MPKKAGKTIRSLGFRGDIWLLLERWAADHNYMLISSDQSSRTYQRNNAPLSKRMLKMISNDNGYVLKAWIEVRRIQRLGNLGPLMPSSFKIDGYRAREGIDIEPMRAEVNLLLLALWEPLID